MGARAPLLEDLDVDVRLKPVQEFEIRLSAGGVLGGAFSGDIGPLLEQQAQNATAFLAK